MLKAKNILLIFIINYLLIIIFSSFGELIFLNSKATNLESLVSLAADMAIEQSQSSDDFFKPGEGYKLDGDSKAYTMKVPHNISGNYIEVNALETMTGKNSKDEIFEYLYVKDDLGNYRLRDFVVENPKVLDIESSVGYWEEGFGSVQWYKIPRIAQSGYPATGKTSVRGFDSNGRSVSKPTLEGLWRMYDLHTSKKIAYESDGSQTEYYMTPMSLGITYIDEEILSYYFMNNLDLLMRAKYTKNGISLKTEEGGNGVLKGSIYTDLISDDLNPNANPINNGSFTLLRGKSFQNPINGAELYEGVEPNIEYKVIDMFDSRNDELLSLVFGAIPTKNGSKAEYFRDISSDVVDPATGMPYTTKPIVVAEITFYADVIIPYSTFGIREMRAKENPDGSLNARKLFDLSYGIARKDNYIDLVRKNTSGLSSPFGNESDLYVYKKIFAIAP